MVDPVAVDPEAYDASEQQFAASLETGRPRFIIDPDSEKPLKAGKSEIPAMISDLPAAAGEQAPSISADETSVPPETSPELSPDFTAPASQDQNSWRNEVTEKLDRYRSKRRPRAPRYPSLRLKFESTEPAWRSSASGNAADSFSAEPNAGDEPQPPVSPPQDAPQPEPSGRVLPFRRSAIAPPRPLEELADPVPLAPRILEAPELEPAPPALGGILIEPAAEEIIEKRPGIEVPLQPAEMSRRILATSTDAALVLAAVALFGYVFLRTTAILPPVKQVASMGLALAGLFWPAYQYVLLVCCGATPGLKLARLHLARFDGKAVPRRIRRWRVLATVISGASLGLGYAWCILDEDQLCWHDRITKTYMAPQDSRGYPDGPSALL